MIIDEVPAVAEALSAGLMSVTAALFEGRSAATSGMTV
jgi:hypothetical protein